MTTNSSRRAPNGWCLTSVIWSARVASSSFRGHLQPARAGRKHPGLPAAQRHGGGAGTISARRDRVGCERGRVLPTAGDDAVHESPPADNLSVTSLRHRHFASLQEHLSRDNLSEANERQWQAMASINTPFDTLAHTADVRNIESRRGKYNIPNIGIYLWRLASYSVTNAPAFKVDAHRYLFEPRQRHATLQPA